MTEAFTCVDKSNVSEAAYGVEKKLNPPSCGFWDKGTSCSRSRQGRSRFQLSRNIKEHSVTEVVDIEKIVYYGILTYLIA